MIPFTRSLLLVAAIGFTAPVAEASWPHVDPDGNLALCTAAGAQTPQAIVPDGAGGAIFVWTDARNGANDVYAQRVSADGTVLWPADGVPVCTASGSQFVVTNGAVSDGAGGVIVLWTDPRVGYAIAAQRLDGSGNPLWAVDGVPVVATASIVNQPAVACSDGAGGAIVGWNDSGTGPATVLAQRVLANGTKAWGSNPVLVCTSGGPIGVVIAPDGAQGAYVGWRSATGVCVQRVSGGGAPQWTTNGLSFAGATSYSISIDSDGGGGALLCCRQGSGSLVAHRIDASGAKLWGADGLTLSSIQNPVYFTARGAGTGGAWFSWVEIGTEPYVVRAQRVNAAGAAQWTAGGVAVCNADYQRYAPFLEPDGLGGLFVAWQDNRSFYDVYVQRLDAGGVPQWTPQGVPICTSTGVQSNESFVFDDRGGLIVGWRDTRTLNTADVYAQRVDGFGYLGDPEPSITSVADVPNDHGGVVEVSWTASYLDPPGGTVVDYQVSRLDSDWVPVGTLAATGASSYSLAVPTTVDSSAAGTGLTTFRVEARTAGAPFWDSATATGYSVDNLGTVGVPSGAAPHFVLEAPAPNPARTSATIRWSLAHAGAARLAVFDPAGRVARVLYDGNAGAGSHATTFTFGAGAWPAGLYLVRLEAGGATSVRRMAIVR